MQFLIFQMVFYPAQASLEPRMIRQGWRDPGLLQPFVDGYSDLSARPNEDRVE
jgi:hypothetical protein